MERPVCDGKHKQTKRSNGISTTQTDAKRMRMRECMHMHAMYVCAHARQPQQLDTHRLRSCSPRTHESEPSPSPSPRGTSADEASSRGRVPRGQPATERVHRCAGHVCRAVPPRSRGVVVGVRDRSHVVWRGVSEVCQEH